VSTVCQLPGCQELLEQPATGRKKEYCKPSHRLRAHREKKAIVVWPPDFERAEEALVSLIAGGYEAPALALERIVLAWRAAA
jgi:hypothetical protein